LFYIFRNNSAYFEPLRRPSAASGSFVQVQEIQQDIGQLLQDVSNVKLDIPGVNAFANSEGLVESNFLKKGANGKLEVTAIGQIALDRFGKKEQ